MRQLLYRLAGPFLRLYWRTFKPETFGVKVLVLRRADPACALLVRHAYGDRSLWNIPGGGYNPKRESALEAAAREVREELDLALEDIEVIGEYQTTGEGKRDHVTIVRGVAGADLIAPSGPEIVEVQWRSCRDFVDDGEVARAARRAAEIHLGHTPDAPDAGSRHRAI